MLRISVFKGAGEGDRQIVRERGKGSESYLEMT